jgi:anti-sigma B factor antagonist
LKLFAIECIELDQGATTTVEVRVSGFLDAHTVASFEKTVGDLLERQHNKFIVNVAGLSYISSAGIGALMVLFQQLRRRDGEMVILQPSAKVYKILDLLGFTKIFQIKQDRDEAIQALR